MQLRSFKAYTNVAPVSPLVLDDATGTATRNLKFPCNLVNLDGYAAAAGWFQIFDLAVAPTSTTTVPLKSINVAAAGNLSSLLSSLGSLKLNKGLYCAMSSTEAVYTAVSTNFDVWGEVEEWETPMVGISTAGDLTTGVDSLQVWADASGPKILVQADVINGLGVAVWLMIFAHDSPVTGDSPIHAVPLTSAATQQVVRFGSAGGIVPVSQSSAFATRDGCTLAVSTTGTTLTLAGTTLNNIRAYYK